MRLVQLHAFLIALLTTFVGQFDSHAKEPLPVYILTGQSNMQGHAAVRTFAHLGMDAKTKPLLQLMQDETGTPRTCKDVWISSVGHDGQLDEQRHGRLTADYGAAGREAKIGPEYTFGILTQQRLGRPILLIKSAWGGKSLHTDFRPPSSGHYTFNENQIEQLRRQGKDLEDEQRKRNEASGHYYRLMLQHVQTVLADISKVYPDYDASAGYQLAGFVWFQGWNDMVDRGVYPDRDQPGGYGAYSQLMAQFIRDVRRDLDAPKLPFVIGVMGAGGLIDQYDQQQRRYAGVHGNFRDAMAAPATMPEFRGNVLAVRTAKCWDAQLGELSARWGKVNARRRQLQNEGNLTDAERKQQLEDFTSTLYTSEEREILQTGKSNAEYHYLGSAKIMARIGQAFAKACAELNGEE